MGKAVIVFIFPEPEDNMQMGLIIHKAKGVFEGMDVKTIMAVREAAENIIGFLDPKEVNSEENGEG